MFPSLTACLCKLYIVSTYRHAEAAYNFPIVPMPDQMHNGACGKKQIFKSSHTDHGMSRSELHFVFVVLNNLQNA